jgi:ferredoxin-nitrate reductase
VISKEKDPFYNRVLLPEYVNDSLAWEKLQKFRTGEFEALNVSLQLDNEIVSIDRAGKYVVDRHQKKHYYDKLILATGSRANLPKGAPVGIENIFTMRTRFDADRLKTQLKTGGHVLIVGGGLLGLELAVSLREIEIDVSILQLGSRLMERQIDNLAGQLLLDYIDECNVTVYMNDQLQGVQNNSNGRLVASLRSGKTIHADALVYAVGTRPNIEFAQDAGIETARGILVNDYLQTNDPNIFAIGEIAEHDGKVLGITSAAEKQADALARFIEGDLQSTYVAAVAMNILKLSGLDLCSIGIAEVPANSTEYEEILFIDKAERYYKKCIIKDDRLVGAILIGDKSEFADFKKLIEDKIELSERRIQLLRSGKASEPILGKLLCACNQVGTGNIEKLIASGCETLSEICQKSGAGLGCGSCKPEIQSLIGNRTIKV